MNGDDDNDDNDDNDGDDNNYDDDKKIPTIHLTQQM